jgi:hypothetical protein
MEAAGLFAERELAIDAHARVQRFFLRLDRTTDFELASAAWRATMTTLGAELARRIKYRAFHAERGCGVAFDAPRAGVLQAAREVSAVFLACGAELEGHPWRLLPFAFELFVAGRVAVAHADPLLQERLVTHGAPNSWTYFMLAELAVLCLEGDVDAAFWEEAFEALVRTSELMSRNPAEPPAEEMTSEARGELYGYRDGRSLRMADVALARAAYRGALSALGAAERRRRLCDTLGLIAAATRFHSFTSVWWTPGATHPLAEREPIAKAVLDARAAQA